MVYIKPISSIVVLTLLSLVKGDFNPWGDWILTQNTGEGKTIFLNLQGSHSPVISTSNGANINSATGCASLSKNGESWNLATDYTVNMNSPQQFVVGFWVNFESTAGSPLVFQFGSTAYYLVSSATDGNLKVAFYSASGITDSKNDFTITVPLSNFYLDKWFFLAFEFVKDTAGDVTVNVYQSGVPLISKNSVAGSTAPFALPSGFLSFGKSVKAKFYEVVVAASAIINGKVITLTDSSGGTKQISNTCNSGDCGDAACISDGTCLAWKQYCTTCDASNGCTTCDPDLVRTEGDYCQSCTDGNTMKNSNCCATANNYAGCSTKSTVCDLCPTGSFLYDDSTTSTTVCLSCADSCTSCKPGPSCYNCADMIVQDGNTCRVDSVGFQISVEAQNIVLDFAHPLSTGLSKKSFTATSISNAPISTDGWTFTCIKGSIQCTIVATSVKESDLPMTLDLEFSQV